MLALLAVAGATLSACTPAPAPSPTPTAAFASEEEAFAAAEETYRAYNDAGNARRDGDSEPDPQDYLVGNALEGDIDALNKIRDAGVRLDGVVEVATFSGLEAILDSDPQQVIALVCLDLANTRILNDADQDVTPDRVLIVAQEVTFTAIHGAPFISDEKSAEAALC